MARQSAALASSLPLAAVRVRPVDLVHLALQTQGNKDLETEVLGLFVRQSTQQVARIAAAGSDRERFEAAHLLKGSARAIGANSVADCAEALETAAQSTGDFAATLDDLRHAVAVANRFIDDLID